MITTILFDLDGTLLPMEQEVFVQDYIRRLAQKLLPKGYDPRLLEKALWKGTGAMVHNNGAKSNEAVFWEVFKGVMGKNCLEDEAVFLDYYEQEFQQVRHSCGFNPQASQTISQLKAMGYQVALATNPIFPAVATHSRVTWAGLDPEDFSLITTYENSRHCKPNPDYYRDILEVLNVPAENCLMVGNDVNEDMIARELGMQVFLLTDNLINRSESDIHCYPHGSFPELMQWIQSLPKA